MSKNRIRLPDSGRAITYETLSVEQVERCQALAAGGLGKDSTIIEFQSISSREGAELMIRQVSDPVSAEQFKKGEAKFRDVTYEQVHGKLGEFFQPKDIDALKNIYLREHVVTKEDVDAILEGKVPVVD